MDESAEIERLRQDRNALDMALYGLGCVAKGKNITCPWHDDTNPSASIICDESGHWRIWCHVCDKGGDVFDLRQKLFGITIADQMRELSNKRQVIIKQPAKKHATFQTLEQLKSCVSGLVASYLYTSNVTGSVDMAVLRCIRDGKKSFIQCHEANGKWTMTAPEGPLPIYNRSRIVNCEQVVVVEGEKDVHTLHGFGIVATTSVGGAGKAKYADWTPLAGKQIILWPDNDTKGAEHMADVKAILEKLTPAPTISRISLIGLNMPPKGDVTDLVEGMDAQTHDEIGDILRMIIEEAKPQGASVDSMKLLEDKIAGKYKSVPWPWPQLSKQGRTLLPGTVTVLCGSPGSNKSFMAIEAAAHWFGEGIKTSIYELEEDRTYHLDRAIAQATKCAGLTDPDWIMANAEYARLEYNNRLDWLDKFGSIISEAPDKMVTLKELADWADAQAANGCRLIIIDPVSAAEASARPWADDLAFIMRIKIMAKKSGASVILVMHPKKGNRGTAIGLDDLAGGAAYQRFAQNVLWLERLPEMAQIICNGQMKNITHMLKILKTRNGPGSGVNLGYLFNVATLCFTEAGIAHKKQKDACEQPKRDVTSKYNRMDSEPNGSEDLFK